MMALTAERARPVPTKHIPGLCCSVQIVGMDHIAYDEDGKINDPERTRIIDVGGAFQCDQEGQRT